MSTQLAPQAIEQALAELPGWRYQDNRLVRTFSFGSFAEALSFLVRVGLCAEKLDHHPELRNVYDRVDVSLCTHDAADRVTQKDLDLARAIQRFSWVE